MFDDLVTTRPEEATQASVTEENMDAQKVEQYTLSILMDVESVMQELDAELTAIVGECHFCGKNNGNGHDEKCQYRLATLRLSLEIDYLI